MEKLGVSEDWLANVADDPTQIKTVVNDDGWMDDGQIEKGAEDTIVNESKETLFFYFKFFTTKQV